jgi:hypothetical protein
MLTKKLTSNGRTIRQEVCKHDAMYVCDHHLQRIYGLADFSTRNIIKWRCDYCVAEEQDAIDTTEHYEE